MARRRGARGGSSARRARYIDGTPASTVASARPMSMIRGKNFGTSRSRAPLISASKLTHRPKMNVSCSGTSTTSSAPAEQAVEHRKLAGEPFVPDDDALRVAGAARGEDHEGGVAQ